MYIRWDIQMSAVLCSPQYNLSWRVYYVIGNYEVVFYDIIKISRYVYFKNVPGDFCFYLSNHSNTDLKYYCRPYLSLYIFIYLYNMPVKSHLLPCRSSHFHSCHSSHNLNNTYAYPEYRTIHHKAVMSSVPLTLSYCSQSGFH